MANGIKTRQAGKNRGYVSSHSWGMSIGMAQPHVARRRLPCRAGGAWEKTGGRREGRHDGINQAGTVKMDIMGGERAPGGLVGGFPACMARHSAQLPGACRAAIPAARAGASDGDGRSHGCCCCCCCCSGGWELGRLPSGSQKSPLPPPAWSPAPDSSISTLGDMGSMSDRSCGWRAGQHAAW